MAKTVQKLLVNEKQPSAAELAANKRFQQIIDEIVCAEASYLMPGEANAARSHLDRAQDKILQILNEFADA